MSNKIKSSFRDPSGFLFQEEGVLYRQINRQYKENYEHLISSGLYDELINEGYLIRHQEVSNIHAQTEEAYKILKPERISFISYPYEWSYSQMKDAALTTLRIQKIAMKYGMILKDSSAYNVQIYKGKFVLIDTLSFEIYQEDEPWIAYKQFCQHFLSPLFLMTYTDIRLSQLIKVYIDGIPIDLASRLLPAKTYLKFSALVNIHLNAKSQKKYSDKQIDMKKIKMSKMRLEALIDSLEKTVESLNWKPGKTEWGDYYSITNYSEEAFEAKKELVSDFITITNPTRVWDMGANTGVFSRLASSKGIDTIAFDIDPIAVEKSYLYSKAMNETTITTLLMDLTNPSPSIGWSNEERFSLLSRANADTAIALALIHHLAISNNVPLVRIAEFFGSICKDLIIEFVPKADSQVQRLLATRKDIFPEYNEENFEIAFSSFFRLIKKEKIPGTERTLYLFKRL
ncbi:MAG: hypothetical protein ACRKFN_12750 [Desulfitobacterium sp.]